MEVKYLIETSESLIHRLERKGWDRNDIFEEVQPFLDQKYRDAKGNALEVMNHFFNSMNLRTPPKSGDTKSNIAQDWLNK